MKKNVSILAIILVCALAVAAFTGIFKTVKDNSDDKTSETTIVTDDTSVEMISFIMEGLGDAGENYILSCPAGMTWGEFVNSEYNINGLLCIREDNSIAVHVSGDDEVHIDHEENPCINVVQTEEGDNVCLEEEIINNYYYEVNLG